MQEFLESTEIVDFKDDAIQSLACKLRSKSKDEVETARRSFEWVRDHIEHTSDFQRAEVTLTASEVLRIGTGFCYAKSHLLAALLRANRIPAGFCYQRLALDGSGTRFCLHGLNAIHFPAFGWYRADARGNKFDVNAEFSPPHERLAFDANQQGEGFSPGIHSKPINSVVECLHATTDARQIELPDIALPLQEE